MAETEDYVFYRREDLAGFSRRLVASGIDLAVLYLAMWGHYFAETAVGWLVPSGPLWFLAALYLYFVVLKRTRVGTLGYMAMGIRIVDLKGRSPGFVAMTLRFLFLAVGPLPLFADLVFMAGDRDGQSLRDKLLQTYVIRKRAVPAGRGRLGLVNLSVLLWWLTVPEVVRPKA